MEYGYVRVSTTTQNVDRQLDEMFKQGLDEKQIYIDKQSGKDFERPNYQKMKKRLKENDLLIIKSIDRLGRNYEMIIEEWSSITKDIKADIVVLDFPLLDTRTDNKNLVGKFISDIVLQSTSPCFTATSWSSTPPTLPSTPRSPTRSTRAACGCAPTARRCCSARSTAGSLCRN